MTGIFKDFTYAFRKLRRAPGFTVTAVLTLALGIGSSAAIFTLLDQVTLRLLPVHEPERLVLLRWDGDWNGSNTGYAAWSYPWYEDLSEQTGEIFEDLIGSFTMDMAIGAEGSAEQSEVALVTGNYFSALGVGAARGRVLTPGDDDRSGAQSVAVLSYEYWRDRFGSAPDALGRTVLINQHPFEVVGVAQRGFRGVELTSGPGVFIPSRMKNLVSTGFHRDVYMLEHRRGRWINIFGRLREGMSLEQAEAALQPVMQAGIEYDLQQPALSNMGDFGRAEYRKARIEVLPGSRGRRHMSGAFDDPLSLLTAMVGLLLLIACGNVANLLMARASGRAKEVAVRLALGSERWRIVRQLLAESALIAAAATGLGLLISAWAATFILRFAPEGALSSNLSTTPDGRVFAFAAALSVLTTFLFGLAPALRATSLRPATTLKDQAAAVAGGAETWRRTMAGAQIFFSLLLLIGAGLFQRSLASLEQVDTGMNTEQNLVFGIDPLQSGYTPERMRGFMAEFEQRLEARPEIRAAGAGIVRVLDGGAWTNTMRVSGYDPAQGENMNMHFNAISPGYLTALEIPTLEGRGFTEGDAAGAPLVGLVNEAFVERFYPGESPVGRHFSFTNPGAPQIEIVGLLPDLRYEDLRQEIPVQVFVPFAQSPFPTNANVYVRSDRRPEDLAPVVRAVVSEMDRSLPIADMRPMSAQITSTLTSERMLAFLASAFGAAATLLAAVGLYGLLSYTVMRRRKEIGLRMALGARNADVARMVLVEVAWLFGIGAASAIPVSLALGKTLESQLHGVASRDPLTMLAATAVLALAAFVAGALPAWRAARIQPMIALRTE